MTSLDLAVSSAITRLHALERALHDSGPWTVEYAGDHSPAERVVLDDGVLFTAEFPFSHGTRMGTLLCKNEPVLTIFVNPPIDEPFLVDVALRLDTSVVV